jgi:gamma-glutamyl hercynylcysteine S-oxide synthase
MVAAQRSADVRNDLLARMSDARQRSDELFNLVHTRSLYERPIPERHRIIFYLGHLEAFDWNLMNDSVLGLKAFHPEFDRLFAFGIDPVGNGLPTDQPPDWPSVAAVRDYLTRVRTQLDHKLAQEVIDADNLMQNSVSLTTLLNVAIEHRLMHVETLAYMLHHLPLDHKVRHTDPRPLVSPPLNGRMTKIPAGWATLGLQRDTETFGWDNEYEAHTAHVPAFEIDQYKITNLQYLEFIAAGGYDTRAFWSDDDWNWKSERGISHPVFWKRVNDEWFHRGMFEETPLPLNWPVYVSHAEATAYAGWAGKTLPTEEQWHRAAYGTPDGRERLYPWGDEPPNPNLGNFALHRWDPTAVNAFPRGTSAFGVSDMLGNGWEWTSTTFAPFPGFEPFAFYRGYSADFFDGKHFVMKGSSARTAACMMRPTFRNWFQAHYQYMYAGFRCVSH